MDVDHFRANRVEKLKEFEDLLELLCNGVESDKEKVKRKTNQEFHFWLEARMKSIKREAKEQQTKQKNKRGS